MENILNLKDISAVIFDLDGLLIDSEPAWHEADTVFFAKYGIPFTESLHQKIFGMGLRDGIELLKKEAGLKGKTEELMAGRREAFLKVFLKKPSLLEGAREIVETVHSAGYKSAIATGGHTIDTIKAILKQLNIEKYFKVLVSSDLVEKGKPEPDVYVYTANKLKTDPKHCLVFEDSPNGVKAGKAAGMKVIGVNPNFAIQKHLDHAGADIIAPSLEAVVPLFKEGCGNCENCACA